MRRETKGTIWENVEQGLGSVGKLKILRVMLEKSNDAFTKYGLEKATGLKPVNVRAALRTLIELEWVREYPYQPRTYRIDLENEVMKHLSKFFQNIRYF